MTGKRRVYAFGKRTDGDATMSKLLGGKGANLAEMAKIGLPVPPGFTISTEVCTYFYDHEGAFPPALHDAVAAELAAVETQRDRGFGDPTRPLLLSVRSGARESMPGMMDTILNLGLNEQTVEGLAALTGNRRFAYDCYRRFIQMYGDVVLGVRAESEETASPFERELQAIIDNLGVAAEADLDAGALADLCRRYRMLIEAATGTPFPADVNEQLWGAIGAVFQSWTNARATLYRQRYGIPRSWGTAVNVQAMVFGNAGNNSGTGVAFTRDPANGAKRLYGEYLMNAQGEDVVAGVRTPEPIAAMAEDMPDTLAALEAVRAKLESHFRDMQDFEFTIEDGDLFVLQTRNGKRTGLAAVRIAVEMRDEGILDRRQALLKVPAESIDSLLAPTFDANALATTRRIARGLPAGPGAATGRIALTSEAANAQARAGARVVLCRTETSPEDLKGMLVAEGVLTTRGGVSSHAALVARQLGKVCVCGASEVSIDYKGRTLMIGDTVLREGDAISLDGTTGSVYAGTVATSPSEVRQVLSGDIAASDSAWYQRFRTVMDWADEVRYLKVRTNADTPAMAREALRFGAEGIGLCRTEHMFFDDMRIDDMRRMILSASEAERRQALDLLLPHQRDDFASLFEAMAGRPVTIRLLDPPLHEFLPSDPHTQRALAAKLGVAPARVAQRVHELSEVNPMLGCRGCRLGILYPEVTEMQSRAIFEAAVATRRKGVAVSPEVMVPLVGFAEELADQVAIVRRVAQEVMEASGITLEYQVGTMIEVPRAALAAAEIAGTAEFFSIGTNDLTQMTLGLSRDDMHAFYDRYVEKDILATNPFATIDEVGVGSLIEEAVKRGRSARGDLKIGICGEHGGDPASIGFCQRAGLDYVSCSPTRVPVARLASAQAALTHSR